MPHLAKFRKGWESENLAQFILYKFSFLARPTNIADDIGSDFFCTLFQIREENSHEYLIPKQSFAIQIKSNLDRIDVSGKTQYLNGLEIPFFVGVVNRDNLSLNLYSGEYLPFLFSHIGIPHNLEIELCDNLLNIRFSDAYYKKSDDSYVLKFPHVTEIKATGSRDELKHKVEKISYLCSLMQRNISSKRNGEYIFRQRSDNTENIVIFAGSGSAKVFRQNFLSRLAEVFYNLDWLLQSVPEQFSREEYIIYSNLYAQLNGHYEDLPSYLTGPYEKLRESVEKLK